MDKLKLTLITPPDFFENNNVSILFVNLTDQEQSEISEWFKSSNIDDQLNLYVYSGEENVPWFLYASNRATYKYMNLTTYTAVSGALASYVLSNKNVFYKTDDAQMAEIYNHINSNRVDTVTSFLERILID